MRIPRKQSPANIYHLVARGTGQQLIFVDDEDRLVFLGLLSSAIKDERAELFAWCLMGNHFHLLIHAPLETISIIMQRVCRLYAVWFNEKTGRNGHLFQERYRSEPITDDAYLLTVVRYIHENPQQAGLAATQEYPWSSYREYIGKPIGRSRTSTSFVLALFGGKEQFALFHSQNHSQISCLDIGDIRNSTRPMPDSVAITRAEKVLGGLPLSEIKALPFEQRQKQLRSLKDAGLSIRQIQRLTGIGRNTIADA